MADAQQTDAWVAALSPLTVKTPGAETPCPAVLATSDAVAVGTRVTLSVSSPQPPIVTGVMQS